SGIVGFPDETGKVHGLTVTRNQGLKLVLHTRCAVCGGKRKGPDKGLRGSEVHPENPAQPVQIVGRPYVVTFVLTRRCAHWHLSCLMVVQSPSSGQTAPCCPWDVWK